MSEIQVEVPRVVKMENGSIVDFGKRANLLIAVDGSVVDFSLSNGKVITWAVQGIEAFTDFQKAVFTYGLVEKIKSNLAKVKELDKLEEGIKEQIANFEAGNFYVRANSSSPVMLDNIQKAYALVKSQQEGFEHLANYDEPAVSREIQATWAELSRPAKNLIRKNVYVIIEKAKLDNADGIAPSTI